jgi:hypothetical protein
MRIIVDAGGLVLMWSENGAPSVPEACTLVELNDEQAAAFAARPPNAGVTFDGQAFAIVPLPARPALTPAQKLAAVGLTSDDLKQLLGLT